MLYFDHAATSYPKPECVKKACMEAFENAGNPGRGSHSAALWSLRTIYSAREAAAKLFNAKSPMEIVFAQNATMALNMAISQADGEILTTAMEHNSVLRPCHARGNYRIVPAQNGILTPQAVIDAIGPDTKAVIMTHASNLTGEVYDIGTVGRYCREKGILFITDAAQTAGVVPIDVQEMGIDMLAFAGHKGPMGPTGTGGLYVNSRVKVRPLMRGGTGSKSHQLVQPEEMPDVLEAGTQNVHGIAGLKAGIEYVMEIGVERIFAHEKAMAKLFIDGISDIPGIEIYRRECVRTGTVAINIHDVDPADLTDALGEAGVCVRGGAHCTPLAHDAIGTGNRGAVRFSFGWSTTAEEVLEGVKILHALVKDI